MPILDLDEARGTFDHVCSGFIPTHPGSHVGRACGLVRRGLRLRGDVSVVQFEGHTAVIIYCPRCGSGESLVLTLGREDEDHEGRSQPHREQSRHIRRLMAHPHVGLHHLVRDCRCTDCTAEKAYTAKEATATTKRKKRSATNGTQQRREGE